MVMLVVRKRRTMISGRRCKAQGGAAGGWKTTLLWILQSWILSFYTIKICSYFMSLIAHISSVPVAKWRAIPTASRACMSSSESGMLSAQKRKLAVRLFCTSINNQQFWWKLISAFRGVEELENEPRRNVFAHSPWWTRFMNPCMRTNARAASANVLFPHRRRHRSGSELWEYRELPTHSHDPNKSITMIQDNLLNKAQALIKSPYWRRLKRFALQSIVWCSPISKSANLMRECYSFISGGEKK